MEQRAAAAGAATTEVSTDDGAAYGPLHERIAEAMGRLRVPGVALGVWREGREHVAGFGVTNVNHPAPVAADTLFQIGSITKTVTATAVMRLVEAGTLDLDAPIRAYLPDLRLADESVAARVTTRHLLTHLGGWEGDYLIFADTGRGDDALARFVVKMADAPQLTPLGEVWAYNNAGFYLAGRVIEAATGQPYEAAAKALVLAPLGMRHALFFPEEVMLHSFAVGHNAPEGGAPRVATPWPIPRNANPAGGITTNAADLLRYARFAMGDGTAEDGARVLSPASLDLMRTPTVAARPGTRVGLAWFVEDIAGVRLISHGGGTNGQIALLLFAPERRFALALLTNASSGGELTEEVSAWALKEYLGVAEPERARLTRTPGELAAYAGRYSSTLNVVELTPRDGALEMRMTPTGNRPSDEPPPAPRPSPVAFCETDTFEALEGPLKGVMGEFLRGPDGGIAWLRMGRLFKREG